MTERVAPEDEVHEAPEPTDEPKVTVTTTVEPADNGEEDTEGD